MPLSSKMCELSMGEALKATLTLCREVSHASRIAHQDIGGGGQTKETCGLSICELCENVNLSSYSEKMWRESSLLDLPSKSWQTLRKWATASRLSTSLLVKLVDHTHGPGCSLLPTPLASDSKAWLKVRKLAPRESIAICIKKGSQDRFIYFPMWNGMSITQAADLSEMMMGWKQGWTVLDSAAMEYFLSNPSPHGKK